MKRESSFQSYPLELFSDCQSAGTQDQLNCQQSLGFALNVFYQIVNLLKPGKTGWYSLYMFYDVILVLGADAK